MEAKKLLAESIGTFTLAFTVLLTSASNSFPIPTPILAGLVVGLFVYTIGWLSGCHLNPAVTVGLLSLRKITPVDSLKYIVAQLVGAVLALAAMTALGAEIIGMTDLNNIYVFIGEILGTALLAFGIAGVAFGKVTDGTSGAVIGGSLILGASLAGLIGAPGFLNPAIALGAKSLTLTTLVAPIIGAVLGMQIYKFLIDKN